MGQQVKKIMIITLGWVSLATGILGVLLPLLPTTCFVLLSAACFAKSSPSRYQKILNHPSMGPVISNYQNGMGIEHQVFFKATATLWGGMMVSLWFCSNLWAGVILVAIGLGVTWYLHHLYGVGVQFKENLLLSEGKTGHALAGL